MALYQGEDIAICLSGKDVVNLDSDNFIILIYSDFCKSDAIVIEGSEFGSMGGEDEYYVYNISSDITKDMSGSYNIEIMIKDKDAFSGEKRSIFKKQDALFIEPSRIKDYVDKLNF